MSDVIETATLRIFSAVYLGQETCIIARVMTIFVVVIVVVIVVAFLVCVCVCVCVL